MLFIDFGNTQEVDVKELKCLPEVAKVKQPQAMECILAHIQPSFMRNPKGLWTDEANKFVHQTIDGAVLHAKVYSVVNNVVHVELLKSLTNESITLNQVLITKGYAEPAEESYLSKVNCKYCSIFTFIIYDNLQENHEKRQTFSKIEGVVQVEEVPVENFIDDIESPDANDCTEIIHLRGPFSPLEMRVYGITNSSIGKTVKVENSSVNTVLLDAEPQDPHTRYGSKVSEISFLSFCTDLNEILMKN